VVAVEDAIVVAVVKGANVVGGVEQLAVVSFY